MNTTIDIPGTIISNNKLVYKDNFVYRNKVDILKFFLQGRVLIFLDYFVPNFYDNKVTYEIASKIYRYRKRRLSNDQLFRVKMIRDRLKNEIIDMKKIIKNEISTINNIVNQGYDQDIIEKNILIQDAKCGIHCNIKYGSFDGTILDTIFSFLSHNHIFRCREVCKGFYNIYLVCNPNFWLKSNYLKLHIRDKSFYRMILMSKDKQIISTKHIILAIEKLRIIKRYYPVFKYVNNISQCILRFVNKLEFVTNYYSTDDIHVENINLRPKRVNMLYLSRNVLRQRSIISWDIIRMMKPKIVMLCTKYISMIFPLESVKVIYVVNRDGNSIKDISEICRLFPNLKAICNTKTEYGVPILETIFTTCEGIDICTGNGKYYPKI